MDKTIRVCDLHDGGLVEATSRLDLALDGKRTRLDLCTDHLLQVRTTLATYLDAGTSATATTSATTGSAELSPARRIPTSRRSQTRRREQVRQWARNNGYQVADRGRVPGDVEAAYEQAVS